MPIEIGQLGKTTPAAPLEPPKAPKPAQEKLAVERIALEEERIYREGTITIRDLISPSAFKVEPSFIQLGDVFLRTIFVVSYPRYISVGWSAHVSI